MTVHRADTLREAGQAGSLRVGASGTIVADGEEEHRVPLRGSTVILPAPLCFTALASNSAAQK